MKMSDNLIFLLFSVIKYINERKITLPPTRSSILFFVKKKFFPEKLKKKKKAWKIGSVTRSTNTDSIHFKTSLTCRTCVIYHTYKVWFNSELNW